MMTPRLDTASTCIKRRCFLLLFILSWMLAKADAQGMTRLSNARGPARSAATTTIQVISDGLSLPRNRDSPSTSTAPSLSATSPTRVPSLLVHVPAETSNPTEDPSTFPTQAPASAVSTPWNVSPSAVTPSMYPSMIPTDTSQSGRTPVVPGAPVDDDDSQMAVDQVLLQINENVIMNAEQISDFEKVCATEFFPIYLVQVYPANYTNTTCTVMSQSTFDSSTLSNSDMESSTTTLAVLIRVTSVVTAALISPGFDDIVAQVVSTYTTPELQELLQSSPPEQTYFASTNTKTETIESTTDNYNRPVVAIIASTLSVAFIILGLTFIVISRKRYHQGKSDPLKATRMDDPSSSGDSVYLDQQQQQQKVTIASHRLNNGGGGGDDFDDEEVILDEEPVIYEKMSLTSHRSQHERRTYNMSFIGLSSTTSGVSSVTNAPSSICTSSTTMISTMPSTPGTGAYTIATRSPRNDTGGCNTGLTIPPIMERLYYETLHGTLRLANSTTTSLSSPKRSDPYSGILSGDDDDDDNEEDTFNSTDDIANKPPPSLVVAITEKAQQQVETTTKSKSSSSSSSSSSATPKRQGDGDQKNVVAGDAASQKERDSIPSVDSRRQPPNGSTEKSSIRSIKGTRSQRGRQQDTSSPPSSKRESRVKRALNIVPSSLRGGSNKVALATPGQNAQKRQQQSSKQDNGNNGNKNNKSASDDDEKAPIYSHTSVEEMVTTDDDTETDTKLPTIIITITQLELPKLGTTTNHPPHHPDDESAAPYHHEESINNVTMTTTTTTKAFTNRSMSINSNTLHGGEIIQSVETELSSVSASLGTVTRNGSSSSGDDDIHDSSSSSESENNHNHHHQQQSKNNDDDKNDADSGKRQDRRNRIVNI